MFTDFGKPSTNFGDHIDPSNYFLRDNKYQVIAISSTIPFNLFVRQQNGKRKD